MSKKHTEVSELPISTTGTTLSEHLKSDGKIQELKQVIARQARELERYKDKSADLIHAVTEACHDAASGLEIPPVPRPIIVNRKTRKEEIAMICVGDLQLAKITPTYSTAICEKRMETYAEAIKSITEIQRSDHPVRKGRVYLLGDIIEGELIFPHQAHQIDSGLYTQVMLDGPRILCNFLRSLLTVYDELHVVCIPGNHGALGGPVRRAYNPESNADRMLYRHIQGLLAHEPRLTWQISYGANESAWYAVDYPFGGQEHGVLTFHGDQIPNVGSASVGTIARRIWGMSSGAIPEPFENVIFGHWHTPKYIPLNNIEVFCNGSTESTNIYAQERLSAIGQPIQLLTFMHPTRGVTAQYWVKLEKNRIVSPQTYLPSITPYAPVPRPRKAA